MYEQPTMAAIFPRGAKVDVWVRFAEQDLIELARTHNAIPESCYQVIEREINDDGGVELKYSGCFAFKSPIDSRQFINSLGECDAVKVEENRPVTEREPVHQNCFVLYA
jgi:hypothetical protein